MDAPVSSSIPLLKTTYKRSLSSANEGAPAQPDNSHEDELIDDIDEDEDDSSTSSGPTEEEEDNDEEHSNTPEYGYTRCPPALDAPDPSQIITWSTPGGHSTSDVLSLRSSDAASITSSKRSHKSPAKAASKLMGGTVTVKNGQLVSVKKRQTPTRPSTKSRSVSEPNILDTKKHKSTSSLASTQALSIRKHKKSESIQEEKETEMHVPSSLSSIFGKHQRSKSSSSTPTKPQKMVTCVSCLSDDIPQKKAAHFECKHYMCRSCVKRLFELSTTDPALMPPRCCEGNEIEPLHVQRLFGRDFLDKKLRVLWNTKYEEFTTKNRLYCAKRGCGQWIKPQNIELVPSVGRRRGTCTKCKTQVCKRCNMKWHSTRDCENDEETKKVIDMAKERQGWQRCYRCKAVVELETGCNHMTCRCGAQFCMLCGRKWRDEMCMIECPLFSVPADPDDNFGVFLVEDDDDWFWPPRRRRERRQQPEVDDQLQRVNQELFRLDLDAIPPPPPPPPPLMGFGEVPGPNAQRSRRGRVDWDQQLAGFNFPGRPPPNA